MFNLISKVMSSDELREPLRHLTKAQLVEYMASVVNLLTHNTSSVSDYGCGWNDSRRAIMNICGLDKLYDIQPLEEV